MLQSTSLRSTISVPIWETICSKSHQLQTIFSIFGLYVQTARCRRPDVQWQQRGWGTQNKPTRRSATAYYFHVASTKPKKKIKPHPPALPAAEPAPGITDPQQHPQPADGPRRASTAWTSCVRPHPPPAFASSSQAPASAPGTATTARNPPISAQKPIFCSEPCPGWGGTGTLAPAGGTQQLPQTTEILQKTFPKLQPCKDWYRITEKH